MKASPLPAAVLAAVTLVGLGSLECPAADTVVLKSGQTMEGRIVGTSGKNLRVKIGGATVSAPLADVVQLRMEPPAEFATASAQLSAGDAKGAAAALEKINQTYAGLPAPWAQQASAMLGDAKLAAGDKAGAKAAYEQFSKTYPQAIALADLGMARLAVESGDLSGASKLLGPMVAKAEKTALPAEGQGDALCQAFYLMGRIDETSGDKTGALENYLKASALFPFDQNAVTDAKKRADALRSENPGLIAP